MTHTGDYAAGGEGAPAGDSGSVSDQGAATAHRTSSHWGSYEVLVRDGTITGTRPDPDDPAPSPVIANAPTAQHHATRVGTPAVRRRWLEHGPGPDLLRGDPDDDYVALDWDTALDLLARELRRVRATHGDSAVYGGSYGWASAGRFHHSQSQLHRFLNTTGGYTRSVGTYSHGAVETLFPHLIGAEGTHDLIRRPPTWGAIAEHTDLLVTFGGLRVSNTWVASGGRAAQTAVPDMRAAAENGTRFVSISPLRDDTPDGIGAEWLPAAPGTDTALMLALMHVLFDEGLADKEFLGRYTVGSDHLRDYVMGGSDRVPKSPEWAAGTTGVPAETVRGLARRMAAGRTLVNVGWSVQRARYGEQPLWAGLALASCLGQVGLPGGGFASGYGSSGGYGGGATPGGIPRFAQGSDPVRSFIPVALVSDMLLHPGGPFDFNGSRRTFPDIRLVWWAGGNPFHHHQDLSRLRTAFGRPETVVVGETHWTATARHADIVLPSTTTLERDDIAASQGDLSLRAMPRAVAPHGRARDEYDTYAALARRLGVEEEFTEGRDSAEWLRLLYEEWRAGRESGAADLPSYDDFWTAGAVPIPDRAEDATLLGAFRESPSAAPLGTPSGLIELRSEAIAGFGYADCPGSPVWLAGEERLGSERAEQWPLLLIANQPSGKLHSQQDMGEYSTAQKIGGRAPLRLHPDDAEARGLADGDIVRVYNDRGSCLAGVRISDALRVGVAQLSTGAWFDPTAPDVTCAHGNPNALTADVGTSALSQGCTGQHVLVEVAAYVGEPPRMRAFDPPRIEERG